MGGVMAARLALAGETVTVLDANREHVMRMRDPGLTVELDGETMVIPLDAATRSAELAGRYDFGLITVKATALRAALEPLIARNQVDTYVSLGNGLVQDLVLEILGDQQVLIGTNSWGATNVAAGHVRQTTIAPITIGEPGGASSDALAPLAELLSHVAEVHQTPNIEGIIWSKLLLNSTFSGMGVLTGMLFKDAIVLPGAKDAAIGLWTEGYRVALAQGIHLEEVAGIDPRDLAVLEPPDRRRALDVIDVLMAKLGQTKASMLQDIERGALTEVGFINGGVVRTGERLGVATPLNAAIVTAVHDYEAGRRQPGPQHMNELVQRASLNG